MDIKSVIAGFEDYLKTAAGDLYETEKDQIQKYIDSARDSLELLLIESASGQLSGEFITERIKEKIGILESQALALKVITTSFSQELINTTIQKLLLALIDALNKNK